MGQPSIPVAKIISDNEIFTIHAYRWGDRENHSYSVGVRKTSEKALELAKAEEEYRGGKYECEVIKWNINDNTHSVIKSIPGDER